MGEHNTPVPEESSDPGFQLSLEKQGRTRDQSSV